MAQILTNDSAVLMPQRTGVSPIGTVSPNTGSTGNTNSTYAQGAYASGISIDSSVSYTVQDTDYQGIVLFNSGAPITVTLNSSVKPNFTCNILNVDSGAITLVPTLGYEVNGAASLGLTAKQGASVYFANRAWTAFVGSTIIPITPKTLAPVAGEYVTGYDATNGSFSTNASVGVSATIVTAKLTPAGANGSQTFVGGLLTAHVDAT